MTTQVESTYLFLACFLLMASFITAFLKGLHALNKVEARKEFTSKPLFYIFPNFIARLFPDKYWTRLTDVLSISRSLPILFFALFLAWAALLSFPALLAPPYAGVLLIFLVGIAIALILLTLDFLIYLITSLSPLKVLRFVTPIVSLICLLIFPFTYVLLKIYTHCQKHVFVKRHTGSQHKVKEEVFEMLHESEIADSLLGEEKKLIAAVVALRQKMAKEVMIPRVDVVALEAESSVEEALTSFIQHGHSRMPIFKESIDNVVGILYFKDLANYLFNQAQTPPPAEQQVKTLMRDPFFTPESKKIHHLLHELRAKKIHLAIVVDEYGGLDGIVSIEDILEELVGEIDDEHDRNRSKRAVEKAHSDKGFIVEGKMTILDLEKELGIQLPHQNNYDTIGGYIFYMVGAIPKQGWKMHSDHFDIEILSSNERFIEKILITPR